MKVLSPGDAALIKYGTTGVVVRLIPPEEEGAVSADDNDDNDDDGEVGERTSLEWVSFSTEDAGAGADDVATAAREEGDAGHPRNGMRRRRPRFAQPT